jgi:hypothetical protein
MARFEASYYPGEYDERLPEWTVVEWTHVNHKTGAKSGNTVWKTYDMEFGEQDAKDMAYWMQQVYNWEVAEAV